MTVEPLILPFRHGPFRNVSYLVACPETGSAAVIDPAWDTAAILAEANVRGLRIHTVLLTHGHDDHSHGVGDLVEATGATVQAHPAELPDLALAGSRPIIHASPGTDIALGRMALRVLHTPGHTAGSISLLCRGNLFTGDTLMVGAMGRPGPTHADIVGLWSTVTTVLRALPRATTIHPGHDAGPAPFATLGAQFARIPALRAESFDAFVEAMERETGRIIPRR